MNRQLEEQNQRDQIYYLHNQSQNKLGGHY